ncbi:hypothetical protein EDD15DRAFT_2517365 [Pisolithus albus]|nr:hypothetical protein EDD15DRAFT_2517365 [Pisolithus albus]
MKDRFSFRRTLVLHCEADHSAGMVPQFMQTVHWPAELRVGSQHHDFYVACSSIKNLQQQLHIFHDGQSTPAFKDFPPCDEHRLRRAAIRAAVLYQPTSANPRPGGGSDSLYEARDVQRSSANELRKCPADSIGSLIESWGGTLLGVSQASRLRYNREWLSPDLRAVSLSLYDGCRRSDKRQHRFQLISSLPAMAYASPQLEDIINTLLAFATMPQFEHENPPDYPDYDLSDGYAPSRHALGQLDSISPQEYWEQLQQEKKAMCQFFGGLRRNANSALRDRYANMLRENLPFSRSLRIGGSEAKAIQEILEQCVRDRGILVVQPEHILSFGLLSAEKRLDDTMDIDEELLQTQRSLHSHARERT